MRRWLIMVLLSLASLPVAALDYRVETLGQGLDHPWSLAFLPDGTMLVTERPGRLRMIRDGKLIDAPVTGVPAVLASGQAGLFEVLADPDFATNQAIYLSFAAGTKAENALRVVRARFDGSALADVKVLFEARPLKRGDVHYGARMALLADGTLAVAVGDGFIYREQAQRLDNHLGKIVRITRDGGVPPDNPFAGRKEALPEIWSSGHRNPQGLVFDASRGLLFAHEHGPRGGDELNHIESGANYGWPLATFGLDYTGARVSPWTEYQGTRAPLLYWTPSIAPAGMAVLQHDRFPGWRGSVLVSALVEKSVRRIPLNGDVPGEQELLFEELGERLRDVREGPDGAIYLLTDSAQGRVLRVLPGAP